MNSEVDPSPYFNSSNLLLSSTPPELCGNATWFSRGTVSIYIYMYRSPYTSSSTFL